ncbi:MAG: hypothetical protein ACYST5_09760 [Planctomycetota bacterium]|jgi:hypothetical protein
MNDNILSTSGKAFQKFISHLTQQLTKPKKQIHHTTALQVPVFKQPDSYKHSFKSSLPWQIGGH